MDLNVVSFDALTLLVGGTLLLIGTILAGFAMVWLYLAWRLVRQQHQRAQAEIQTLHQEQEMERAAHAQVARDLETRQNELALLHSQFNASKEEASRTQAKLESSNQRATHLQKRTQILERDLQEQQTKTDLAERTVARQRTQIADLTNQVSQAGIHQVRIAALETELQTTRGTVATLTDELAQAKEQAAQFATLAALREADQSLQAELGQLRAQVEEDKTLLAESNSRLNQARQRADRVAGELERHKIIVAELTRKAHEAQLQSAEWVALRSQVQQDKTLLSSLTNQLEQEREKAAQVSVLEEQVAKRETRIAELKSQLAASRKKTSPLTRLRKSAANNRATIADLKKQVRLGKRQIKTFQTQSQKREAVIVDLTTRLYRSRQEAAENLQLVRGIGPIYAARLRAGGIATLNALANASVTQLQGIIQPRRWQRPAFDKWIKQAQRLSRKETLKAKQGVRRTKRPSRL